MPPFSAEWPGSVGLRFPVSDPLKRDGYSEGTVGAVQTFFLRGQEEPWTAERLSDLDAADVVIHLAREAAKAKIYPAVDLRTSRSRLIETGAVAEEHRTIAEQVHRVLAAALWNAGDPPKAAGDRLMVERTRKLQNYFTQPFFVAEQYTHRPGTHSRSRRGAAHLPRYFGRVARRHPGESVLFCRRHRGDPQSSRRGPIAGGGRCFHATQRL